LLFTDLFKKTDNESPKKGCISNDRGGFISTGSGVGGNCGVL
jgi:hypothetical protein